VIASTNQPGAAAPGEHNLPARIGLLAGEGDFPLLISKSARSNGHEVFAYAIRGFAGIAIEEAATETHWVELGQLNHTLGLMKQHGISAITMAGRVPHKTIFQYRHFDSRLIKVLGRAVNRKADGLLAAVCSEFESEGIRVLDSTLFLRSFMPPAGLLTPSRSPTATEQHDLDFGFPIANAVAGQDIGQTVVVKEKAVIAVEGMEGTDECVLRAGQLAGPGCVVIKVSKPRQDMRFDVPVVGPGTIKSMAAAGATALGISAGECLLLHRERVLDLAREHSICIIAR